MIKTGRQPISILTYLAIMSVCFVINLPGIVVTPMEGKLKELLHVSELEIQLLTILPNFVIIPFVLLTGRLSLCRHKLPWIIGALFLYLGCGIAYMLTSDITGMIIISCLLGCANGILIPFAMGFVVNTFYGKYRTRQLGMKSATSNLSVVAGSFIVGAIIQHDDLRLPFVVYLFVLLPLIFSFWLKNIPGLSASSHIDDENQNDENQNNKDIDMKKVWGLIGNNVSFSFIAMSVVIFLPQLIQSYNLPAETSGAMISVFFICVLFSGFVLLPFVRLVKEYTFPAIALFLISGLALIVFVHNVTCMYIGASLSGMAFGFFQPFIYDKTSYTVTKSSKAIIALSYVLTALYLAIAVEPFIVDGIGKLFHIKNINAFVFTLSFYMAIAYFVVSIIFRKQFTFSVEKAYYDLDE